MGDNTKLSEVYMIVNPEDNGGEQVSITVEIYDNGDLAYGLPGAIFTLGKVSLQSYGNSASISLPNITPEFLREFADKLEAELVVVEEAFGE